MKTVVAASAGAWAVISAAKAVDPTLRLPAPEFAAAAAGLAALLPGLVMRNPTQAELIDAAATAVLGTAALSWIYAWEPRTPFQGFVRDTVLSIGIGYGARLAFGQGRIPTFSATQIL